MKRFVFIAATLFLLPCATVHGAEGGTAPDQVFEDGIHGGVLGGLVGGFLDMEKGDRIHASAARYHRKSCNKGDKYFRKATKAEYVDERIALMEKGIKFCPDNPAAHNDLGLAQMLWGDLPAARTHFNESLQLDPDYNPARINMSRIPYESSPEDNKSQAEKAEKGGKHAVIRSSNKARQVRHPVIRHTEDKSDYLERRKRWDDKQKKRAEENRGYD